MEIAEQYADKQVKNANRKEVEQAIRALCGAGVTADLSIAYHVSRGTRYTHIDAIIAAQQAVFAAELPNGSESSERAHAERSAQAELVREIFGNPFRPVTADESWLTWKDHTVPKLAQAAYDERQLPSGHIDTKRLAMLADALEEAGCTSEDVLAHLRGPGPHVRGCWVVDLVLSKDC
ncbi:MAG: hypothetical protein AB7K24_13840 [Gemmataceae bacterium]